MRELLTNTTGMKLVDVIVLCGDRGAYWIGLTDIDDDTVGANPDPGATWSEKQPGFDQVEKTTWKKVQFSGCFKTTWESTILRWFQNNLKKYNFQVVLKQPQKKLRIKVAKSHVVQSDFQVVLKTTWNYKNTRNKKVQNHMITELINKFIG